MTDNRDKPAPKKKAAKVPFQKNYRPTVPRDPGVDANIRPSAPAPDTSGEGRPALPSSKDD